MTGTSKYWLVTRFEMTPRASSSKMTWKTETRMTAGSCGSCSSPRIRASASRRVSRSLRKGGDISAIVRIRSGEVYSARLVVNVELY
jgi:hypothetical protein